MFYNELNAQSRNTAVFTDEDGLDLIYNYLKRSY